MSEYEKMKANKVPLILSIVLYEENVHVNKIDHLFIISTSQPVFTCSKLTIETLEQGVKYV